jgi:hypothetical protein
MSGKYFGNHPAMPVQAASLTDSKTGSEWKTAFNRAKSLALNVLGRQAAMDLERGVQEPLAASHETVRGCAPKSTSPATAPRVVTNHDDDEKELTGQTAEAAARCRERDRISAILSAPGAFRHPIVALKLALNTRMTRKQAIATLDAMPATEDAAATNRPQLCPDGNTPNTAEAQTIAAGWHQALKRATAR